MLEVFLSESFIQFSFILFLHMWWIVLIWTLPIPFLSFLFLFLLHFWVDVSRNAHFLLWVSLSVSTSLFFSYLQLLVLCYSLCIQLFYFIHSWVHFSHFPPISFQFMLIIVYTFNSATIQLFIKLLYSVSGMCFYLIFVLISICLQPYNRTAICALVISLFIFNLPLTFFLSPFHAS